MPREYEERTCINPQCQEVFTPHDFRQIYCTTQCRINFFNDERRLRNSNRYPQEQVLRQSDKILERLYNSPNYNDDKIEETVLLYSGVNFKIGTWEENLITHQPIRWYHAYGLELVERENRFYTIHFRTKFLHL